MSSEMQSSSVPRKARMGTLVVLCAIVGFLWLANWFLLDRYMGDQAARGQFGDMFGAANALFAALAFAGLIYTVLLQRDQLALQQQEIVESGKTQEQLVQRQIDAQEKLFERQKAFQEEQRQKQMEHERKLEQMRQDFEEIVEGRRKDRETQAHAAFERNVLRAIRRELEALGQIYDKGIGAYMAKVQDGQVFEMRLGLTQDWFTVFNANAVHLGKIEGSIAQQVVTIYALMKALIEEYRINNDYVDDWEQILLGRRQTSQDQFLIERQAQRQEWMLLQVKRIKEVETKMRTAVKELYDILDKRDIH
jgi:tRNA-dihydrouridine synthase